MNADLEVLAGIIELLDRAEFTQFSFEQGDLKIAVSRGGAPLPGTGAANTAHSSQAEPESSAAVQPANTDKHAAAAAATAATTGAGAAHTESATRGIKPESLAEDEVLVRSPMLGTLYRASKPGAPAFVEQGSRVTPDSTLCIVEVMKLMNSVAAGVTGEVVHVLVGDGELVEFDQPLFVVKVSA